MLGRDFCIRTKSDLRVQESSCRGEVCENAPLNKTTSNNSFFSWWSIGVRVTSSSPPIPPFPGSALHFPSLHHMRSLLRFFNYSNLTSTGGAKLGCLPLPLAAFSSKTLLLLEIPKCLNLHPPPPLPHSPFTLASLGIPHSWSMHSKCMIMECKLKLRFQNILRNGDSL